MTKTLEIRDGDVTLRRSTGRFSTVINKPKATQQLKRILSLDRPAGAGLNTLVGTVPTSEFEMSADAQRLIRDAFDVVVQGHANYQLSDRSAAERLVALVQIFVVPARFTSKPSKTGYALRVDALTAAGQTVTQGGALTPPQGG